MKVIFTMLGVCGVVWAFLGLQALPYLGPGQVPLALAIIFWPPAMIALVMFAYVTASRSRRTHGKPDCGRSAKTQDGYTEELLEKDRRERRRRARVGGDIAMALSLLDDKNKR